MIREARNRCMKSGQKASVKAGAFGFNLFGRLKENSEAGGFVFLVNKDASLNNGD